MSTLQQSRLISVESTSSRFREDIQGLRAIAVGLVVIYHIWPESIPGGFIGVDVFLVISGFLITSHLLKAPPRKPKDFTDFWARRIRRLLPASLLVLLVTLAATFLFAAETVWSSVSAQIVASALYVQNWMLAVNNVDYLAADNAPTPVQHYWSLSVEEQFYLVWPLLIAIFCWVGYRYKKSTNLTVGLGMVVIILASLAYSISETITNPGWAYFATTARVWELAIGGLTALILHSRPNFLRGWWSVLAAWCGVIGIIVSSMIIDETTPFPGAMALLPVLSSAAVILANSRQSSSPNGLLALKPMQYLGGISFSIYLWHWPIIVLLPYLSGELGWFDKIGVLALTIVLASLTKTYVEDKFRLGNSVSSARSAYKFAAFSMVIVVAAGSSMYFATEIRTNSAQERAKSALMGGDPCLGAKAMSLDASKCPEADVNSLVLEPTAARIDKSDAYKDGCWSNQPYEEKPVCTYGNGKKRVALVGNSHAGQWLPALQAIAEAQDWTIDTFLIDRCNPTTIKLEFDAAIKSDNCFDYGKWVLDRTTSNDSYDLVITSERQSLPVASATWEETETLAAAAYADYLKSWIQAGLNVVIIKDPPYPGNTVKSIPDCVATNAENLAACAGSKNDWHWMDPLTDAAKQLDSESILIVDLDDYFCREDLCLPIIGSVITYFDGSHVTATYARSLATFISEQISAADW